MDQDQLFSFMRIVREGSFSRAARTLGVSQAAISGRMQALERELGGPLFVRGGRRATLTEAGETFLPYARRALDVLAAGQEAVRQAQSGRVVVGAVDSIADGFLVPVVVRFRRAHPDIALSIRTGHTPQIVQELTDGIVRLGLVTWQYTAGAVDLELLTRFREPLVAVVAPHHALARRDAVSIEQVVHEGDPYHEAVWGTAEDARLAPSAHVHPGDQEFPHGLMRRLILAGVGTGFLPEPLAREDVAAGRLVALPLIGAPHLTRELALVRHARSEPPSAAARELIDAIRDEAARSRPAATSP